jgi:hypothetical protein
MSNLCCVCYEEIPNGEEQVLECGHNYCKEDFKTMLRNSINDKDKKAINCFACENPFSMVDLRKSLVMLEAEDKKEKEKEKEKQEEPEDDGPKANLNN